MAAFSHFISPIDLLMAYGLANILAAIPITPGGLGVVEFVLVSMITGFGPTAGQALSAVLAYRAVNFWLPIPFGGLAYASLEFETSTGVPTPAPLHAPAPPAPAGRKRRSPERRPVERPIPGVSAPASAPSATMAPSPVAMAQAKEAFRARRRSQNVG